MLRPDARMAIISFSRFILPNVYKEAIRQAIGATLTKMIGRYAE